MKVILNSTVPKVGKAGTVITVADGFARNYLFPRGLAILADKRQVAALERRLAVVAAKTTGQKTAAEAIKAKIDGATLKIEGKLGADGIRLIAAVTNQVIADALKSTQGIELDKKQFAIIEPIKRLGTYDVEIDLHQSVHAKISVIVLDPATYVEPAPVVEEEEMEEEA